MARLRDIIIHCAHPASLARFWAAVLDDHAVAPYDDAELARLRAMGVTDVEDDPSVLVESADPAAPRYFFSRVPAPERAANRLHLDLWTDRPQVELDRLIGLGAVVVARRHDWVVLADPEGNEFCLFDDV